MTERPGISIFDTKTNNDGREADVPASPFPVSRRGYDPTAVDRKIAAIGAERDKLATSLQEATKRVAELENQLRQQVSESEAPTYAGLGGRASELLRLAEEQADEVTAEARTRADEILRTANAEAAALKTQAARDADDMRMVQLKELDEARTSAMGE